MSEPANENPTPADVPAKPVEQGDPVDLGDGGKKALDAERRRANDAEKQLKSLQARLDEIEAAKLSDLEKAQKRAAEADAAAAKAQAEVLRYKVAAKYGISDEDAELFLTGSDEDTLTRQAQRLADRETQRLQSGNVAPSLGVATQPPVPLNSNALEQALKNKLGIA